ncbi:cytochrome c class I [Calothrix parasitica NIES-267]|uniref:Cytochrome c class I n=1 Tax=Calothrix parasitica NIES-267 TaxID=1973488 RepID=A0A1Z4LR28_9CYAN|nr:cytochrome c class I [Calothrix parasitica NIES-267]
MKSLIKIILFTLLLLIVYLQQPVFADTVDGVNGAKIFSANCAGCHINGGNIIRRGKNLKMKALKKYKMDSVEAISNIVTYGKNNMSAYKDRLSESEIQSVSTYVLEQAENNWRKR